jgi:hypothetical protein
MLSLYRARLMRGPVPVPGTLVVVAVYGTIYATWRAYATWSRLGRYAPMFARIPIDEQFGLGLLGGTRVPCPNTDKVAGGSVSGPTSGGFVAHSYRSDDGDPYTELHCWTCTYRNKVAGQADSLRAEGRSVIRHPPGWTVIHADALEAPVPHATTGFDFERGCLTVNDGSMVLVYGSPRARLTDHYLDTHLGPAERVHRGPDGALWVVRAS